MKGWVMVAEFGGRNALGLPIICIVSCDYKEFVKSLTYEAHRG